MRKIVLNFFKKIGEGRETEKTQLSVTTGGIIGGQPVVTAKAADAASVVHRWDSSGSSVTTGGLRLVSNPGVVSSGYLLYKPKKVIWILLSMIVFINF